MSVYMDNGATTRVTEPVMAAMAPYFCEIYGNPSSVHGFGREARRAVEAARALSGKFPILGVCLGHQAICAAFGATVTYAKRLMHGKQSMVILDTECPLFRDCPEKTKAARYHSLAADPDTIPDVLNIIARTEDGEVMAVEHRDLPIYGVQFHPESILTPDGRTMLKNFLNMKGGSPA